MSLGNAFLYTLLATLARQCDGFQAAPCLRASLAGARVLAVCERRRERLSPASALAQVRAPGAGRLRMCEGSASPDEQSIIDPTYARTKEKLILQYKGYLAGTVDTDGETLPEWRIENRQIKLEAQGISAASAPRRASEAIARTREKYLRAFLADGNSPEKAQTRYKAKTKGCHGETKGCH